MLQGQLDDHLGYEKHAPEGRNIGTHAMVAAVKK